nr:hypothetical protein [Tanacetum cinerariifolium]
GLDKGYNRFQRLLSLLEIHGARVSTKDANQKSLRSLPSVWSNISLIMRNKPGIDNLDINDLYNNLKVYEANIKGSSGSSSKSQNAQGSSSYADELMFLFFANQSNSPQLDIEDLEQIDQDDLEEMDLKWQVAMLSMRVKFQRLLSLLEIHGARVSTKDANQKFLRSLPSVWSNISLIMRNKPGIDNLDIDDLYNNLKVYEADIKGSSGSSSKSQNVAFVSTKGTSSTNKLNDAYSVSTTTCHSFQAQGSSSYADELMFLFFANQSNSPQLDIEDLEQIDQDDLEEMDLKWQVAMLSMRVKGNFARDGRSAKNSGNRTRDVGNAWYRGRNIGKRPAKEEDENALVVQDRLGTYDWSYQVEEEPTDFVLMAFTSNHSSYSSINSKHEKLRKANLEIIGYQYGLESIEEQLRIHQQNEVIYEEKIRVLEYVVKDKREEVTETVFDNRSSDENNSLANDRFNKGEGYHAVPPPLTGNFMPPKFDLSLAGLDDSIYKFKITEIVTSLTKDEKDAPKTSTACVDKPKEDRSSAPLIQD